MIEPTVDTSAVPQADPFASNPYADAGAKGFEAKEITPAEQAPVEENWDVEEPQQPEVDPSQQEPTGEQATPPAQMDGRRSRKDLSEALEAAEKKAAELEAQGQEFSKKHQDAEASIAELKKQIEERDRKFVEERAGEYDPAKDEEVVKIGREIGSRVQATVPFLNSEKAKATISSSLPAMLDGFAKSVQSGNVNAFRDLMKRNLFTQEEIDDDPEKCQEDMQEAFSMLRALMPHHLKYQETLTANKENWDAKRIQSYVASRRTASERISRLGALSQEEIKADPLSANSVLSGVLAANPKLAEGIRPLIDKFVDLQAGPPPLKRGATPAEISAYRAAEQQVQEIREKAVENAALSFVLPQIIAHLHAANQKLLARVNGAAGANKPSAESIEGQRKTSDFDAAKHPGDIVNPYAR